MRTALAFRTGSPTLRWVNDLVICGTSCTASTTGEPGPTDCSYVNLSFVKKIGRFVPKVWPLTALLTQARLRSLCLDCGSLLVLPVRGGMRPKFWQRTAKHSDK